MKMALSAALQFRKKLNVSFSMSFYWRELLFIIIVALFGLLRYREFFKASFPSLQLLRDDIVNLYYPILFFAKRVLASGTFPFWDPHTFLGHPIGTNLGFGIFYPPLLGLLSLPFFKELTPRCLELFTIWHFVLAGIAVYISSRILRIDKWGSLIGSIAYTSFPVNNYMVYWTPMVCGIPWASIIIATFLRMLNSKNGNVNRGIFLLYIFSSVMLYTTLFPSIIAYTFINMFLLGALNIIRDILRRRPLMQIGKRYLNVLIAVIMPILLLSFLIIPVFRYLPLIARRVIPLSPTAGPVSPAGFWNILFPGIAVSDGPLCYFGIIFLGVVFFYCIFVYTKLKNPFLGTAGFASAFWLIYGLEGSPLFFFIRSYVPLMGTMRYASRSLVMVALFFSFIIGDFFSLLTHRWKQKLQFLKLNKGLDLLLPVVIISILCYTSRDFLIYISGEAAFLKHFVVGLSLLAVIFFFITVPFRYSFRYNWRKTTLAMSIFLLIIGWAEVVHFAPISFIRERKAEFAPYSRFVKNSLDLFPEVYKNKSLYRHHNFGFKSIVPYWTGTYTASSVTWPYMITSHTTTPAAYYYLWSREWPGSKDTFYTKSGLPLDSPVYDLMGVKYFLFPDKRIWIYLSHQRDYYKLCKDEWFSGNFKEKGRVSHFRIYLKSEFKDPASGKGVLYLDNGRMHQFDLSGRTGWQWMEIPLKESRNFKITIKRNGMSAYRHGPRDILLGCTIGEIEFYDDKGTRILINKDSIVASSAASLSSQFNLTDNDIETTWKPSIEDEIVRFLESKTVKRLKPDLYLNTNVLPRAFMVYDYEVVKNRDELWKKLHSPDFEPERAVLLEKDPGIASEDKGPYTNEVRIEKYNPNSVDIYADTPGPGFLILSDTYAPGWEVLIDGRKKKILLAYGIFRAVWVDKGRHRIHFQYLPPFFRIGLTLSIGSLVFLLYILRRPKGKSPLSFKPSAEDKLIVQNEKP